MGLFQNLSTARVMLPGQYLDKMGLYMVRVNRIKRGTSPKHNNAPLLAIELTVLHVIPSDTPETPLPVGYEGAIVLMSTNQFAASGWINFLTNITGLGQADLDNPGIRTKVFEGQDSDDWASNEDPKRGSVQPLRGFVGIMRVVSKATGGSNGKPPGLIKVQVWERGVSREEVTKTLSAENLSKFFPGNALQLVLPQYPPDYTALKAA